jgi:23S rRNA G2445 N2-methylase RlmL
LVKHLKLMCSLSGEGLFDRCWRPTQIAWCSSRIVSWEEDDLYERVSRVVWSDGLKSGREL